MATIVPFTPRSEARSRPTRRRTHPATIVIFPGVRYEKRGQQVAQEAGPGMALAPGPKTPGAKGRSR